MPPRVAVSMGIPMAMGTGWERGLWLIPWARGEGFLNGCEIKQKRVKHAINVTDTVEFEKYTRLFAFQLQQRSTSARQQFPFLFYDKLASSLLAVTTSSSTIKQLLSSAGITLSKRNSSDAQNQINWRLCCTSSSPWNIMRSFSI